MKIVVKTIALTCIGVCISLMLMHLLDLNNRIDEVDKASHIAMTNTQIIMLENIEDIYYGTNNRRQDIKDSGAYLKVFEENLTPLISSDGICDIDGLADPYKGLLYVNIRYKYKNFLGNEKTINKKLINVIDVVVGDV